MSIVVAELNVYPVKSCHGIALREAVIDERGIVNDRAWMLTNSDGEFITQRECARLALVKPEICAVDELRLTAPEMPELNIVRKTSGTSRQVRVWDDLCLAIDQGDEAAEWFNKIVGKTCRLVCMQAGFQRAVDPDYASRTQQVGFADGFPFLLISEASLSDLNSKLEFPIPMNRFRPNIVITGCESFAEDGWKKIRVGTIEFDLVKPCSRCVITTIDQEDAIGGKEPLRTLSAYRKFDNKLLFGQNLVHHKTGSIKIGDPVEILS